MIARLALVLLALPSCIDDHYTCTRDTDCNLGIAGRCELDHLCTTFDDTCPLDRRYTAHSGDDSGKCYVEQTTLADPCAPDQPPAPADDPCAALVCGALPSCCNTGWSEPCVQLAQTTCKIKCDTRIAITAWRGNSTNISTLALYDLRFDGSHWSASADATDSTFLEWIAPAPGDASGVPRLASFAPSGELQVATGQAVQTFAVPSGRTYQTFATVDFDRAGRDTAMLATNTIGVVPSDDIAHVLIDLASGEQRTITSTMTAPLESWGDIDGDPFPDAVAETTAGAGYHFVQNELDQTAHVRGIDDDIGSGGAGANQPDVGAFVWTDINGDGALDLVEMGGQIAIHVSPGAGTLSYNPSNKLDCDPPVPASVGCTSPQTASNVGFVGAAVPTSNGVVLVVGTDDESQDMNNKATYRSHVLWSIASPTSSAPAASLLYRNCRDTGTVFPDPCLLFRAVVARDLDGNGTIDVIAIDDELDVYTLMGNGDGTFGPAVQVLALESGATTPTDYTFVRASVTGARR